jgi:hypothetical protein
MLVGFLFDFLCLVVRDLPQLPLLPVVVLPARFRRIAAGTAAGDSSAPEFTVGYRIALAMWLKRLFGRGERVSPSGHAPSRKETEQDREDRLEDFMDEQVRQRDEDESRMQDEGGS